MQLYCLVLCGLFHVIEWMLVSMIFVNTLRRRQNGRHFPDDIFKCIFLNENVWISIKISLRFVPKGPIDNIPALVQIMAWRRPGNKPLSEPMMVRLLTHICVTRPQWVNERPVLSNFEENEMSLDELSSINTVVGNTYIRYWFISSIAS